MSIVDRMQASRVGDELPAEDVIVRFETPDAPWLLVQFLRPDGGTAAVFEQQGWLRDGNVFRRVR